MRPASQPASQWESSCADVTPTVTGQSEACVLPGPVTRPPLGQSLDAFCDRERNSICSPAAIFKHTVRGKLTPTCLVLWRAVRRSEWSSLCGQSAQRLSQASSREAGFQILSDSCQQPIGGQSLRGASQSAARVGVACVRVMLWCCCQRAGRLVVQSVRQGSAALAEEGVTGSPGFCLLLCSLTVARICHLAGCNHTRIW
ncbi:Hypothetical predicted protein [Pelobates cultripes]|uniref:Uncharacterized protein n=1 Tax=Pelobates cultripes TaxID=61616 RepID=A0AAD1W8N1_PELCU|nr:Hypothetical predicted protein [Pelobates cultripes]